MEKRNKSYLLNENSRGKKIKKKYKTEMKINFLTRLMVDCG